MTSVSLTKQTHHGDQEMSNDSLKSAQTKQVSTWLESHLNRRYYQLYGN